MQLRYNFRLYPTPGQRRSLARAFGCARVVFNDALAARREAHAAGQPYPSSGHLGKRLITEAKKTPERAWLAEVSNIILQQALRDLDQAYGNFFDSLSGRRKGAQVAPPRLRSRKDHRQAIRFRRGGFSLRPSGKLYLAKIGEVPVRWSRKLPREPSSVSVILDAAGRYFASFVVEVETAPLPKRHEEVGVDLGLSSFAVLSDGTMIENPRLLRQAERKLRKAQQSLSRKQKGSNNRQKARAKLALAHVRVADARRDFAHKLSTQLIRENQAVYVENLCVKALARTRLAKSVHDAGWSQFLRLLEEKAGRYGRHFGKVNRFYPSSQTCSACGRIDGAKPLYVRTWTCACGVTHDRDVNAARNILAAGRAERQNACGEGVRPGPASPALAALGEAGTLRGAAHAAR
ncbi:MAG: RNA-guided endonuclease InsQ/TnpB family protein [Thermoanaerobaculia bacterium]